MGRRADLSHLLEIRVPVLLEELYYNGVRGLMLDMYDFEDDIWLCHSFLGQCYNFTAFVSYNAVVVVLGNYHNRLDSIREPAINTLKEVETFLTENPLEIVTIIIEDYVHSPKGLTKLFTNAGLLKYWYPVSKMPTKGGDWPTVTDMVAKNYRLLVFTSDASKEADEGIAYQWKYLLENEHEYFPSGFYGLLGIRFSKSKHLHDTAGTQTKNSFVLALASSLETRSYACYIYENEWNIIQFVTGQKGSLGATVRVVAV
ncbi:hypothetical protein ACLOJK_035443 [Asimina triloba]